MKNENIYYELSKKFDLKKKDLIFPLFVQENKNSKEFTSIPGLFKISYDNLLPVVEEIAENGIRYLILFGIPKFRDNRGKSSINKNGIVQKSLKLIKSNFNGKITLISDICVCQYNKTGHCGILQKDEKFVDNDLTIDLLSKIALSHAEAGVDIVAPSAMMDGQVEKIRKTLDIKGYDKIKILSFSAKQSTSLYKPFRSETFFDRGTNEIDKSAYQVSYNNPRQIQREIEMDIIEGADMVLIKPAFSSLDLIYKVKKFCKNPIIVQVVSGEYAMIKAASKSGLLDENYFTINLISSLKRAGADKIMSYSSLSISRYFL
ncbi:MAG TPA: porphobilinogen synthase [Nitrososphaeraceae archaeon]|nr:porphobilinogen synthase [Nitrososphaeraceae archaeon]